MNREIAEKHWEYTERLIDRVNFASKGNLFNDETIELMRYLYVEAMLHGAKHEREEHRSLVVECPNCGWKINE